jgi:hypothetical protein
MTLTPEQRAELALNHIFADEVHRFYKVKVAEAIRQAVEEEKQLCILDAWDTLRWELGKVIGVDKVDDIGAKVQETIRQRQWLPLPHTAL